MWKVARHWAWLIDWPSNYILTLSCQWLSLYLNLSSLYLTCLCLIIFTIFSLYFIIYFSSIFSAVSIFSPSIISRVMSHEWQSTWAKLTHRRKYSNYVQNKKTWIEHWRNIVFSVMRASGSFSSTRGRIAVHLFFPGHFKHPFWA